MSKPEQKPPEGTVVRDDGCICPAEEEKKVCKKPIMCPHDPRFPNANQTRHCYISFLDYQKCARLLGDYPGCAIFYKCYMALCPQSWYTKWYEQMDNGTFPRKIYPPSPVIHPDPDKMEQMCLDDDEDEEPQDVC